MINATLRQRVDDRLTELLDKLGPDVRRPRVTYYNNKLAAGRAVPLKNEIQLNAVLLAENQEDMLHETVAHELAHLYVYHRVQAGAMPRSAIRRPHGREWQGVMRYKLGVEPSRTHAYDVGNVKARRQRRWKTKCACQVIEITTARKNKMLRGAQYRCRACKVRIELIPHQ